MIWTSKRRLGSRKDKTPGDRKDVNRWRTQVLIQEEWLLQGTGGNREAGRPAWSLILCSWSFSSAQQICSPDDPSSWKPKRASLPTTCANVVPLQSILHLTNLNGLLKMQSVITSCYCTLWDRGPEVEKWQQRWKKMNQVLFFGSTSLLGEHFSSSQWLNSVYEGK